VVNQYRKPAINIIMGILSLAKAAEIRIKKRAGVLFPDRKTLRQSFFPRKGDSILA
jgi:hypothetical protein